MCVGSLLEIIGNVTVDFLLLPDQNLHRHQRYKLRKHVLEDSKTEEYSLKLSGTGFETGRGLVLVLVMAAQENLWFHSCWTS